MEGGGGDSVIVMLQLQLAEARKAAEVATAAKERALSMLEEETRAMKIMDAERQLQDVQARSQAVKAIGEVQGRAEQRIKETEAMGVSFSCRAKSEIAHPRRLIPGAVC